VTFFAAYDNPAFTLLPQVRHMTGETNPWTVVLQPFLWTNQAHMGPRVLHADALAQDIAGSIEAEQLVPIFPKTVVLPEDPGAVHGTRGNVDADRVRTILRRAAADEIHLISAYYTQASAADVPYMKLLRVLVAALRDPRLADQKPVVVALLGDEASDAARVAFKEERRAGTAANLAVNTPTLLDDLGPLAGHVVLEHVGRSGAMGAFLHRSFLFVTEGANTWQEVLSVGTPAISARPTGETQPWLLDMGEPDGAQAVRRASEALVTLAKAIPAATPESEQEDDGASAAPAAPATPTPGAGPLSGHPTEMTELVDFLLTARDEPDGAVRRYFRAWSQRLSNPRSNQFKAAVDYLEQQGVVLNTK
jgi:hypothetical protein